jgi:hypothetical protein
MPECDRKSSRRERFLGNWTWLNLKKLLPVSAIRGRRYFGYIVTIR